MGGIEAGLVVGLRAAKLKNVEWPMTVMAILSALLLALGVLRHYWDIWTHRTVRGISFIFVALDAAGDLFSLISVFFQLRLDVKGMAIYGTELILWLGVFACGGYYNFVPWLRRTWDRSRLRTSSIAEVNRNNLPSNRDPPQTIMMHDLPSSTSVFRTPLDESSSTRARALRRSSQDGRQEAGTA